LRWIVTLVSNIFSYFLSKVIDHWFSGVNKRPFINYALEKLSESWRQKDVFLIEAPTGYGKTTISATLSLYTLKKNLKIIVSYPLRTLLEDQYGKFLRLPIDRRALGKRYMHNPYSRYLIKPITLTTIDTLSLTLFGLAPEDLDKVVKYWSGTSMGSLGHYLFSWASVFLSNLVLDEVHLLADSTKSLNFLAALIKIAIDNNQKLVLMSATIPRALKQVLSKYIGRDYLEFISFEEQYDLDFVDSRRSKSYDIELTGLHEGDKFRYIRDWLSENISDFNRVIIVFNTVKDAIEFYDYVKNDFSGFKKILLHSQFAENDRSKKINLLKNLVSKGSKYIVISTQVIEAGVDISSNLFVTELAPANSLIQRLGRFLRYDEDSMGRILIWYEINDTGLKIWNNKYKVYDASLVERTLGYLNKLQHDSVLKLNFHLPSSYESLINSVYVENNFSIDTKEVNDFIRLLMNLERGSVRAFDKFYELEGSFVRDSTIIPVVPEDIVMPHIEDESVSIDLKELNRFIVPISFGLVKKMNIKYALVKQRDLEKSESRLFIREIQYPFSNVKSLLKYMWKFSVEAFMVKASYDDKLGLLLG